MIKDKLIAKFNNSLVGYLPIKMAEGLIGILALKVYTSLFAPQIYGQYTLTNTTISIFSIVCLGWIVQAISRFSNAYAEDQAQKDAFFSTIIFTWMLIIVLLTVVFIGFNAIFPEILSNLELSYQLILIILWVGYSVSQVMLSYLLYSDNRLLNAVLLLCSASVKLGLTYVLTLFMGNILLAIFISQSATDLMVGIVAILKSHLKPYIKIKAYSKKMLKQLIAYGYPLMGMGLVMTLLNMSDRYIIKIFYNSKEVGLYTSNYSLASAAFTMLMVGLSRGSYPKILEAWNKKDFKGAERTLSAGGKYFMMFGLPAAIGLLLLSKPIANLCLGADYIEGYPVIGIVAFAMLFCGLSEYKNKGWELKAHTLPILVNSLIAAFVNILLNLIFIPIYGYIFAAYSTLIAFFVYFLVSSIRENKTIKFRIPKKNTWNILISCVIMSIIVLMFDYFFLIDLRNLTIVIVLAMVGYFASLYILGEIKNEVKNLL